MSVRLSRCALLALLPFPRALHADEPARSPEPAREEAPAAEPAGMEPAGTQPVATPAAEAQAMEGPADTFAWSPLPVARFAAGPSIFLDPTKVYFSADITAGAHFLHEPIKEDTFGLVWGGDVGFTHEARGFNAFSTAPHVGLGMRWFSFLYQPRLLIGSLNDVTTVGMRNSAVMHFLLDMGTVEVGHQFVGGPSGLEHDVRVLAGLNPAPLVLLLIQGTAPQR